MITRLSIHRNALYRSWYPVFRWVTAQGLLEVATSQRRFALQRGDRAVNSKQQQIYISKEAWLKRGSLRTCWVTNSIARRTHGEETAANVVSDHRITYFSHRIHRTHSEQPGNQTVHRPTYAPRSSSKRRSSRQADAPSRAFERSAWFERNACLSCGRDLSNYPRSPRFLRTRRHACAGPCIARILRIEEQLLPTERVSGGHQPASDGDEHARREGTDEETARR